MQTPASRIKLGSRGLSSSPYFSNRNSPSSATSLHDSDQDMKTTPSRRSQRASAMSASRNIKTLSKPISLTSDEDSSGSEIEIIKQSTLSAKAKGKKRAITPESASSDQGSEFEAGKEVASTTDDESDVAESEHDDEPARTKAADIALEMVRRIDEASTFGAALEMSDEEVIEDITMEEAISHVTPKKKTKFVPRPASSSSSSKPLAKKTVTKAKVAPKSEPNSEAEMESASGSDTGSESDLSILSDDEQEAPRGRKARPKQEKVDKDSKFTKEGIRRSMSPDETKDERKARKEREKEFIKSRHGKLTHYEKNQLALEKHHPELAGIWESLESDIKIVAPVKAPQPAAISQKLLPFQLEGLYWMKLQEAGPWRGGMLADEMGMGKTIQTISLICSDFNAKAKIEDKKMTLIIAPTVAIVQWRNEFNKFTKGFKIEVWHGGNRSQDVKKMMQNDIILTSYAVLESVFRRQTVGFTKNKVKQTEESILHKIKWHRIILDEAHNIKDRLCNTAKASFQLRAKYRWCLSGTPLQNRVGELYSLIRFLGVLPFAAAFCKKCDCRSLHWAFKDKRHCNDCGHTPMQHVWFWNNEILKPIQRYGHLNAGSVAFKKLKLLLDRMMLRRTKVERADDLSLPPRTIAVRRDYFTEEEEELYTSLYSDVKRNFETYLDAGTVLNNYGNIFTLITRMRQMACHPDLVLKSKTAKSMHALLHPDGEDFHIHTCRICLDEAEEPIMGKCRHIFCRECIREVVGDTGTDNTPECPVCHVRLIINLDAPALEQEQPSPSTKGVANQGMLDRIDPSKWRTSTKIEALVEELSNLRNADHTAKSLVFAQSTSFLDLIARRLQLSGFKIARLQGSMSPEARDRTVNYFMNNNEVTVFLLSLKAGGVALNLTEASHVYICDPWWNPSAEVQAMDRIHRIGQKRPIRATRLIIENSIESRIHELQKKKESMIDAAFGDTEALGRLTEEDLRFLFVL